MSAQMPASVHVVTTTRNKHFVGLWLSSCLPAGTGGASGIASAAASATLPSLLRMGADVGSSLITLPPHRMGAAQRQGGVLVRPRQVETDAAAAADRPLPPRPTPEP